MTGNGMVKERGTLCRAENDCWAFSVSFKACHTDRTDTASAGRG